VGAEPADASDAQNGDDESASELAADLDGQPSAESDAEPADAAVSELVPEVVPEDAAFAALGELGQSAGAPPSSGGLAPRLMPPPPPPEPVQPAHSAQPVQPVQPEPAVAPNSAPAARPGVVPPMSMRSASWEGTAVFAAGQMTALVRPPSQPGMGVVASVISGPSGTRVGSVQINADGLAQISLSEPARGAVSVAWFAVPAVDENLRPSRG
jgi:hypothetical protein